MRNAWLGLVLACLPRRVVAQSSILGTATLHPDRLAGVWEARAGGTIYGIAVEITAQMAGRPKTLAGVPQTVTEAEIGVFARPGPVLRVGEVNWFVVGEPGAAWAGTHLLLGGVHGSVGPEIDLDLTYDRRLDAWSGRFRRSDFDRRLLLERPRRAPGSEVSALAGTWSAPGAFGRCLHIAQSEDGSFQVWDDRTVTPGLVRYANGIKPPATTLEFYGRLGTAQPVAPNALYADMTALSAGGNTIAGSVFLQPDGNHLSTGFDLVPGVLPGLMTRVRGGSCLTPAR